MNQWLKANRLNLNVKKTKYMILGSKNRLKQIPEVPMKLTINNEQIEKTDTMKNIVMMIDENLEFSDHIDYI